MTFTVRPALPADCPALAPLLGQLGWPADPDEVRPRLDRLLQRTDGWVVVAADGTSLGGMGAMHLYWSLHADRPGALITGLVVSDVVRGRGIGRALVAALEARARALGCDRIMVTTGDERSAAQAFYERIGYESTGRRYVRSLSQ